MQLTLTFTNNTETRQMKGVGELDVMVNSQQRIIDTIQILQEAGKLPVIGRLPSKLRSVRKKYMIQPEQTYEQANIYYGDILEIIW